MCRDARLIQKCLTTTQCRPPLLISPRPSPTTRPDSAPPVPCRQSNPTLSGSTHLDMSARYDPAHHDPIPSDVPTHSSPTRAIPRRPPNLPLLPPASRPTGPPEPRRLPGPAQSPYSKPDFTAPVSPFPPRPSHPDISTSAFPPHPYPHRRANPLRPAAPPRSAPTTQPTLHPPASIHPDKPSPAIPARRTPTNPTTPSHRSSFRPPPTSPAIAPPHTPRLPSPTLLPCSTLRASPLFLPTLADSSTLALSLRPRPGRLPSSLRSMASPFPPDPGRLPAPTRPPISAHPFPGPSRRAKPFPAVPFQPTSTPPPAQPAPFRICPRRLPRTGPPASFHPTPTTLPRPSQSSSYRLLHPD